MEGVANRSSWRVVRPITRLRGLRTGELRESAETLEKRNGDVVGRREVKLHEIENGHLQAVSRASHARRFPCLSSLILPVIQSLSISSGTCSPSPNPLGRISSE